MKMEYILVLIVGLGIVLYFKRDFVKKCCLIVKQLATVFAMSAEESAKESLATQEEIRKETSPLGSNY